MTTDRKDEILAQIIMTSKVQTKGGQAHSRGARWVGDVMAKGVSAADLLTLHKMGVITLSRRDLPQVFERGFNQPAIQDGIAEFHFIVMTQGKR